MVTLIQVVMYGLVVWLGCYLIARDPSSWRLRFAGLALVAFALNIAISAVDLFNFRFLQNLSFILFFIPPIFWFGAVLESLPEDKQVGYRGKVITRYGIVSFVGMILILSLVSDFPSRLLDDLFSSVRDNTSNDVGFQTFGFLTLSLVFILAIVLSVILTARSLLKNTPSPLKPLLGWATFFFASGYLLLLVGRTFLSPELLFVGISADLLILGTVIVVWDAMDAGESLLPDMLRSFTSTFLMTVIVVGQVIIITPTITDTTILLMLALITTVIVVFAFEVPLQNRIDAIIFSRFPHIRQQRQQQRVMETITIRRAENPLLDDETEFIRYTRRALSHYGDLSKLATNPLTNLTIIRHRLDQRGAPDDSLERAKELKNLLHESILRLKPNGAEFGISDEWRHYNALYFPYVAGLKPYSIRAVTDDKAHHEVLTWFRSQVPERTLYNWQNVAASLIAKDLRERTN
jgi:hypothetical protein